MTGRQYIKPPRSQDCVWRSGPPPEIGWWPADCIGWWPADCYDEQRGPSPSVLRWWDGEWSGMALDGDSAERAGRIASLKSITPERFILWTDRWWEGR